MSEYITLRVNGCSTKRSCLLLEGELVGGDLSLLD